MRRTCATREAELGEQIYRDHCASCHGVELGEGQPGGQRCRWPDAWTFGAAARTDHAPEHEGGATPRRLLFEIDEVRRQALAPPGDRMLIPRGDDPLVG